MKREEALKYFMRRKKQYGLSDNVQEAEDMAIEALKEPPRVHAQWKYDDTGIIHYCSNCNIRNGSVRYMPEFCSHCGAIMDGEVIKP